MLDSVILLHIMIQDFRFLKVSIVSLLTLSIIVISCSPPSDYLLSLPLLTLAYVGCCAHYLGWADFWLLSVMGYCDAVLLLQTVIAVAVTMTVIYMVKGRHIRLPYAGFFVIHWLVLRSLICVEA